MSDIINDFRQWPDEEGAKYSAALELFGRHIAAKYFTTLAHASEMANRGKRHKSPTTEQKAYEDWLEALSPAHKALAVAWASELLDLQMFGVLVAIDGASGRSLGGNLFERIKISIEIQELDDNNHISGVKDIIQLNSDEEVTFHDMWDDWKDDYSPRPHTDKTG